MATNELLSYPLHDRHRISKVLSSKGSLQYTDKNRNDLCIMTFERELGPLLVPTWKTLMCKTLDVLYACSRQRQVEGSSHFA